LLGFSALFLPLLVRTHNWTLSLGRAIPLLFACICTFIANDLNDIEKDRTNHPNRPLPSKKIAPAMAVVFYFASLIAALFLTRKFVTERISFLYYALILLSLSYGYIVDYVPTLKAPYVALISSIPVLIVATWYPQETKFYLLAASFFFLCTGRELCMDIKDRAGDVKSFVQALSASRLAKAAFFLQGFGLPFLIFQADNTGEIISISTMIVLLLLSSILWFKFTQYQLAIIVMKLQFFAGLWFLL
jgi:geranylgeranylglycerol-phosphate geranylgeranyltransferase